MRWLCRAARCKIGLRHGAAPKGGNQAPVSREDNIVSNNTTIVRIPDMEPIVLPRADISVEEARRALEALNIFQVATARGSRSGDTITFEREAGSTKG